MAKIGIVDTTLRDGHQCLWATRMSTATMLPVAEILDHAGFLSIEVLGAVQVDAAVRYLGENPWERLRLLRQRITATPLQALIRSKCALGFDLQPDDIQRLWIECLVRNGIRRLIAFDGLHDLDNLADGMRHAKRLGAYTTGWLIYSDSPVHTDELYVAKAREFIERCEADALMIEDASGVLTPERVRTLVPALKAALGDVSLGLHSHGLIGLPQRTYLEAARLGVDNLYTCIPPLADGNAPPSVRTTVRNLRHLGFTVDVDDAAVADVAAHFERVAEAEGKPRGQPADFDAAQFDHQIPGGVLSNLAAQLAAAGLADRLDAVLEECGRVRAELGWPIQVTPFAQLIGVQATLNLIAGERYARVPDEVKKYALGYYGRPLAPVDPEALDRIVANGSPAIPLERTPPEPALPRLRKAYPGASDEALLLYHFFPRDLADGALASPGGVAETPLVDLLREILSRPKMTSVAISKGALRLRISD